MWPEEFVRRVPTKHLRACAALKTADAATVKKG
jgi:hypothetical protein